MFINKLIKENKRLIDYAFYAHENSLILPDTYLIDLDMFLENAKKIKEEADKNNIELYFMLKQLGRNPLLAKELMKLDYAGCVAVDYKEALVMLDNDIPLANVGHLEQVPISCMERILNSHPKVVTIYSYENALKINDICKKLNITQDLLLRVYDDDSVLYSGQIGGIDTNNLEEEIIKINNLSNVKVKGFTIFPALLYNEKNNKIEATENIKALNKALLIAKKLDLKDLNINLPSATCCASLPLIKELGGTSGEPGHGISGTTPLHKENDCPEKIAYLYVSEISHNFKDKAYCYGGGHYRRSHMENVLVGKKDYYIKAKIKAPSDESIDYHYEIDGNYNVGDTCIMAYRTQIFTTRSAVAIVKGLSNNKPEIIGIYNSQGILERPNWK